MTIETATFLVQRGGAQFKCSGADLQSKLQVGDIMAVTRPEDNETYKWSVAEALNLTPFRMKIDTRLKYANSTTSNTFTDFTLNNLGTWWIIQPTLEVNWGDGTTQILTEADGPGATHDYAVPGEYVVTTGLTGYSAPRCIYTSRILEVKGHDDGSYALGNPTGQGYSPPYYYGAVNLIAASSDTFDYTYVKNCNGTYQNCVKLTTFEGANFGPSLTSLSGMFQSCEKLTTIGPITGTSSCTDFSDMFKDCESLTVAPSLDTSAATSMASMFNGCEKLAVAPVYDITTKTNMGNMFDNCESLTSAAIGYDFTNFSGQMISYLSCPNLTYCPPNIVDGALSPYMYMFNNCALTVQSVENYLVSVESCGLSNGGAALAYGTNAPKSTWTAAASDAYDKLIARGYSIYYNE